MSDTIAVQFLADSSGVIGKLGLLAHKTPKIMARVVNDQRKPAIKWIAKETVKIYDIRQKDVTESVTHVGYATPSKPYAKIRFDGVHKNMYDLKSNRSGNSLVAPRKEAISYIKDPKFYRGRIKRGSALKPLGAGSDPKPFVRTARNGHTALFTRVRPIPGLDEIRGVSGPAVPQELKNDEVWEPVRKNLEERMVKRADHYIEQAIKGASWV